MKTITIRDLRQRWPETEKSLQVESEIVITRDGVPVAKLVRIGREKLKPRRWKPEAHMRWLKSVYGDKMFQSSDAQLAAARADRELS